MIIDSHVHLGEMLNFKMPEDMILDSMKKYNIDYSIVSNVESSEFGHNYDIIPDEMQVSQKISNIRTLNFVKNNQSKAKGLFWIKPHTDGFEPWIEEFLIKNKNYFCGLKMHPFHSNMKITDEKVLPYITIAEKLNLPFAVHTAGDVYADSQTVYDIAKQHPKINFIMVHLGLGTDNEKAISLIEELPNLYGDTTWVKIESVFKAIEKCGSEKILFGTDSPIDGVDTYEKYTELINALNLKLSKEEFENVMFNNAIKIFNLPNLV